MNNKFIKILTMPMLISLGITPMVIPDKRNRYKGEIKAIPIKKMLINLNIEFKKAPTFIECTLNGKKLKVMERSPYGVVNGVFLPYIWTDINGTAISENYVPVKQDDDYLIPVKFLMKNFDLREENNEFYFDFERISEVKDKNSEAKDIEKKAEKSSNVIDNLGKNKFALKEIFKDAIEGNVKDFNESNPQLYEDKITENIKSPVDTIAEDIKSEVILEDTGIKGIVLKPEKGTRVQYNITLVPILKLLEKNNINFSYKRGTLECNLNGKKLKVMDKLSYATVNNSFEPYVYKNVGVKKITEYYIPVREGEDFLIPVNFLKEHYGLVNEGDFYYLNKDNNVPKAEKTIKYSEKVNTLISENKDIEVNNDKKIEVVKEIKEVQNVKPILLLANKDTDLNINIYVVPIRALMKELGIKETKTDNSVEFVVNGTNFKIYDKYQYGYIDKSYKPYVTDKFSRASYIPKIENDDFLIPTKYLEDNFDIKIVDGKFMIPSKEDSKECKQDVDSSVNVNLDMDKVEKATFMDLDESMESIFTPVDINEEKVSKKDLEPIVLKALVDTKITFDIKVLPIKALLTELNVEFKSQRDDITFKIGDTDFKLLNAYPYGHIGSTFEPYVTKTVNGKKLSQYYVPKKQGDDLLIPVDYVKNYMNIDERYGEYFIKTDEDKFVVDDSDNILLNVVTAGDLKEALVEEKTIKEDVLENYNVDEITKLSKDDLILIKGSENNFKEDFYALPIIKLLSYQKIQYTKTSDCIDFTLKDVEFKVYEQYPYAFVNKVYKPYLVNEINGKLTTQYYLPKKKNGDLLIPLGFLKKNCYLVDDENGFSFINENSIDEEVISENNTKEDETKIQETALPEESKQASNITANVNFDINKIENATFMDLDEGMEAIFSASNSSKEEVIKENNNISKGEDIQSVEIKSQSSDEETENKKKLKPIVLKALVDTKITFDIKVLPIKALLTELNVEFKSQRDDITFKIGDTDFKLLNAYPYGHIGSTFEPYVTKTVNGKKLSQYYVPKKQGDDLLIPVDYVKNYMNIDERYGEYFIKTDEDKFVVDDSDNILLNLVTSGDLKEALVEEKIIKKDVLENYNVDEMTELSKEDLVLIKASENNFKEDFDTLPIIKLLSYQKIQYTKTPECIDFILNDIEFKIYEQYPYGYVNKMYKPYLAFEINGKLTTQYYLPEKRHGDLLIPVDFLKKNCYLLENEHGFSFEIKTVIEEEVINETEGVNEVKEDADIKENNTVSDIENIHPIGIKEESLEEETEDKKELKPVVLKALVDTKITFDIETLPIKALLTELKIDFKHEMDAISFKIGDKKFKFLSSYPYGSIDGTTKPYVVKNLNGKKLSQYYIPKKHDGDILIPVDYIKEYMNVQERYGEFFIKNDTDKFVVDDTDNMLLNIVTANEEKNSIVKNDVKEEIIEEESDIIENEKEDIIETQKAEISKETSNVLDVQGINPIVNKEENEDTIPDENELIEEIREVKETPTEDNNTEEKTIENVEIQNIKLNKELKLKVKESLGTKQINVSLDDGSLNGIMPASINENVMGNISEDILPMIKEEKVKPILLEANIKNRIGVDTLVVKIKLLMKQENIQVIEHPTNLEMDINGKVFKLFDKYPYGYIDGAYFSYINKSISGRSATQYFIPIREDGDFLIPIDFLKEHLGLVQDGDELHFKETEKQNDIIELDDIIDTEHIVEEKVNDNEESEETAKEKVTKVKNVTDEYTIFTYTEDLYAHHSEDLKEVDNKIYTSKLVENKIIDLGFVKDDYGYIYNSKEDSRFGLASFNKRSGEFDMQFSLYCLSDETSPIINEIVKFITPIEYKKVFEAFNDDNSSYPMKFQIVADTRVIEFKVINKTLLISFGPMVI